MTAAVDTNILVYAYSKLSPFNKKAKAFVKKLAEGGEPWVIPWPCVHEFISITTNPIIITPKQSLDQVYAQLEAWMASPSLQLVGEGSEYFRFLKLITENTHISGAKIHDARIVALCCDNGVDVLYSADRDFSRFKGVKVVNPLV